MVKALQKCRCEQTEKGQKYDRFKLFFLKKTRQAGLKKDRQSGKGQTWQPWFQLRPRQSYYKIQVVQQ